MPDVNEEGASIGSDRIEKTDIETILSTDKFNILFYALEQDEIGTYIWVLGHQKPNFFHHSPIQKSLKKFENHSGEIDKKNIFTDLVKKSYDKLKVRGEEVKCEDRSLAFIDDNAEKDPAREIGKTDTRCAYFGDHQDEVDDKSTIDNKSLELLYDALIAPIQNELVKDEIVIIPDEVLFTLPFAALQDPKTKKFLSETNRIRFAPSLTTLKALQESSDVQHNMSGALIVGNPETGKPNLPEAEHEAEEIAKLLGVEPLLKEQATKEAVIQKLKDGVSVIHFAAHGSQENGQILLAPSESSVTNSSTPDKQDFTFLTMKDVQDIGLRAQLVVLSCCHSGRGEVKAEGVVGMSRAFLAAGARAVVASLWAIDDQATKVFMLKFYSHLKNGESTSESLQQAMKDMRETEGYKEPMYWAGFFLIGDDVTISL